MDNIKEYILQCEKAIQVQECWRENHPCKFYSIKPDFMDAIYISSGELDGIFYYGVNGFQICTHYHRDSINGLFWQIDHGRTTTYADEGDTAIWIPRQDQLQGMIDWEDRGSYILSMMCFQIDEFYNTCGKWVQEDSTSMEQLWLAFVMKEKFNKIWNGKDWEEIK